MNTLYSCIFFIFTHIVIAFSEILQCYNVFLCPNFIKKQILFLFNRNLCNYIISLYDVHIVCSTDPDYGVHNSKDFSLSSWLIPGILYYKFTVFSFTYQLNRKWLNIPKDFNARCILTVGNTVISKFLLLILLIFKLD